MRQTWMRQEKRETGSIDKKGIHCSTSQCVVHFISPQSLVFSSFSQGFIFCCLEKLVTLPVVCRLATPNRSFIIRKQLATKLALSTTSNYSMWQYILCLNGFIPFTSLATGMSPVIITSYPFWRSAEWLLVRRIKMLWLIAVSIGLNCLLETQYHTFRCQFSNVRILPCSQFRGKLFLIWAKNPQVTISAEVREHFIFPTLAWAGLQMRVIRPLWFSLFFLNE